MKKEEFLTELRKRLAGIPKDEIENRVSFYEEMINDKMDDGRSEEEAVEEIGSVDYVVHEIAKDIPFVALVKEKVKPDRSLKGWEIALLILGFPLWFPLVLTGLVLCLVAYLLIWVMVIVTYSIEAALIAGAIGGIIAFFSVISSGGFSLVPLGASLMAAGGAVLMVFACIAATKGTVKLSAKIVTGIKASLIKKGK